MTKLETIVQHVHKQVVHITLSSAFKLGETSSNSGETLGLQAETQGLHFWCCFWVQHGGCLRTVWGARQMRNLELCPGSDGHIQDIRLCLRLII